jgi:hypothetical protein
LIKKFARRFVMLCAVTNVLVQPYFPVTQRDTRETRRLAPRLGQWEKKMKTTIFTIAGAALIALSTVQFADAAQHRHRAAQYRDTNASAAPSEWATSGSSYGGGVSAPAGR